MLTSLGYTLKGKLGKPDIEARAGLAYDANNLYIAADVTDDVMRGGGGDRVEVVLGFPGGALHEIELYPGDPGKSAGVAKLKDGGAISGAKVVEAPRSGGWTLEASVPWSALSAARNVRVIVGLVFQATDDQLVSPTVREAVAFGPLHLGLPRAEVEARVQRALASVGLSGFEEKAPYHLSIGQRKRAALATVLSMDPEILVLDEPSAGLDPRGRRELINLLRELPHTMLVSTHDMRLVADVFPRTLIMDGGRVVADGPTAKLLTDGALLEQHGLELP